MSKPRLLRRRCLDRGASLLELIVGMAFAGIFTVMLHQFSRSMVYGVGVLEAASEAEEAVRVALHVITADLRNAGFSPAGGLGNGIRNAREDGVDVVADHNGDGDSDDPNERVGYATDDATRTLRRSMGLAPPQPFLPNLVEHGVTFRYYDAAGNALLIDPPDAPERADIRRIEVTVHTELPHPDPTSPKPIRIVQSGAIALRNE
jgi:type II secretory pathway component PulJ